MAVGKLWATQEGGTFGGWAHQLASASFYNSDCQYQFVSSPSQIKNCFHLLSLSWIEFIGTNLLIEIDKCFPFTLNSYNFVLWRTYYNWILPTKIYNFFFIYKMFFKNILVLRTGKWEKEERGECCVLFQDFLPFKETTFTLRCIWIDGREGKGHFFISFLFFS